MVDMVRHRLPPVTGKALIVARAAPTHGEPADDGEEAVAPGHEPAATTEHSAAQPEEKGFFGSMLAMVLGDGGEKPLSVVSEPNAENPAGTSTEEPAGH